MPVIPADPISPAVIVLSIVILAVALGVFVMLLGDEGGHAVMARPLGARILSIKIDLTDPHGDARVNLRCWPDGPLLMMIIASPAVPRNA